MSVLWAYGMAKRRVQARRRMRYQNSSVAGGSDRHSQQHSEGPPASAGTPVNRVRHTIKQRVQYASYAYCKRPHAYVTQPCAQVTAQRAAQGGETL